MDYFAMQSLRQHGQWDCGVEVFGKLSGISREEVLRDLPEAYNGITVSQWEQWLIEKGFQIKRLQPEEEYTFPALTLSSAFLATTGSMRTAQVFTIPIRS
jgi:hypothetical protein